MTFTLFAAAVVGLFVAGRFVDLASMLSALREEIQSYGRWAPLAFIVAYVLLTLLSMPGTPMTVVAAVTFGMWEGFVWLTVASTLASVLGFFIARYVARDAMEQWLSQRRSFQRIQSLVRETSLLTVLTMRVIPIYPYPLVNYSLGLTRISFWKYIGYSEVALLPTNLGYLAVTDTLLRAIARREMPWVPFGIAMAVAAALIAAVYFARRRGHDGAGESVPCRS